MEHRCFLPIPEAEPPCRRQSRWFKFSLVTASVFCLVRASSVVATPPMPAAPQEAPSTQPSKEGGEQPLGFLTGVARSQYLLGDMWGLRPALSKYGISLTFLETSEVLGNA